MKHDTFCIDCITEPAGTPVPATSALCLASRDTVCDCCMEPIKEGEHIVLVPLWLDAPPWTMEQSSASNRRRKSNAG